MSASSDRPSNRRYAAALVFMVVGSLAGWLLESYLMVTTTPSLKHRLYFREKAAPKVVKRGDYICFERLDPKINGGKKFSATKIAKCVAGEQLRVDGQSYYCGEEYLGMARRVSSSGEKLPHFIFNGPIPTGKVFAFGDHPDSYDSRYWGFVGVEELTDRVHPIW
jgi:conjugal transfer pilin signal peptidase TrbI